MRTVQNPNKSGAGGSQSMDTGARRMNKLQWFLQNINIWVWRKNVISDKNSTRVYWIITKVPRSQWGTWR